MTGKTHSALGLFTGLAILHNNPDLSTYSVVSGVWIGSLIPDLDTQKSHIAQLFPPISWLIDKITKHRGFTHTMFPLLLLLSYYYFNSNICLWVGIGACTHLILDVVTKTLKITCTSAGETSKGEETIFVLLWISITYMFGSSIWEYFNLSQFVPDSFAENITQWKKELLSFAK